MDTLSPEAAESATGQLTPAERAHLVRIYENTRDQLLDTVRGLTPEQWNFKPGPEVWSIAECCDHIGGAEVLFLKLVRKRLIHDPDRAGAVQGKEKLLRKAVPNRSTRVKVPIEIRAFGHTSSPEEFEVHFRETRDLAIEYARTTEDPLHMRVSPHFMLGDFDGAQWLEIIAEHCSRHRAQIEEVKASPGYPAA
jgi:hypothetical protein